MPGISRFQRNMHLPCCCVLRTVYVKRPIFVDLQNPVFFRLVRVDQGGGGIVWNDDLDISEAYCWEHGAA